jgi:hypothetical protein
MNLLLEALSIFEVEVLIKTEKDSNKVDIYNEIRGINGVVVVISKKTHLRQCIYLGR